MGIDGVLRTNDYMESEDALLYYNHCLIFILTNFYNISDKYRVLSNDHTREDGVPLRYSDLTCMLIVSIYCKIRRYVALKKTIFVTIKNENIFFRKER